MSDGKKTAWAVKSGHCGDADDEFRVYLTHEEYVAQLSSANTGWVCPHGIQAHWDDAWNDAWHERTRWKDGE